MLCRLTVSWFVKDDSSETNTRQINLGSLVSVETITNRESRRNIRGKVYHMIQITSWSDHSAIQNLPILSSSSDWYFGPVFGLVF